MTLASLVRASLRSLLRRPAYALLTVATLAVGVGGSTAVFALVDGVVLESVPFPDADELVTLDIESAQTGFGISLSVPNYVDLRDRSRVFSAFGASAGQGFVRRTDEGAEPVDGRMVLGDFFDLLGLEPALGRVLGAEETGAGAEATAVLGHGYWSRALGADPEVVGRTLVLDGTPHTVVGVLEPGAGYPRPDVEVYTPMGARAATLPWDDRDSSFGARALARLAPGVTPAAAQSDVDRIAREVDALEGRAMFRARVVGLEAFFLGDARRGLGILMGAVLLVLLIAGANVANLALARSERRRGELAVRAALGASRGALIRLLLVESLLVALVGGAAGVALAALVVTGLPSALPVEVPALVLGQIGIHPRTLLFALGVSVASGVLFGMAPGLGAVGRGPRPGRLRQGRGETGSAGGRRLRDGLVVAQVGLSVVLLVGAGLLLRSLGALSGVEKGFQEEGVLTAALQAPRGTFDGAADWLAFNDGVLEGLAASPEVEATAMALLVPLAGRSWEVRIWPEGVATEIETASSVLFNVVSEDYFEVLGVPLRRGRAFRPSDGEDAPLVAVIDETMAERFWPGEDPVGRRVTFETDAEGARIWRTVVGVAANTRHYELESPSRIQVYVPMRQTGRLAGIGLTLLASVPDEEATGRAVERLRALVARLEPSVPVSRVRTLEAYVADALGATRALGAVTGVFGAVATLLAGLGIFGVLSLAVARRRREIGVRLSLGATPASVVSLVVGRGMALVGVGAVLGGSVALAAGRSLESFLFQVRPAEPAVYLAALALLGSVALAAVARPALRAARTPPAAVLRGE